MKNCVEHTPKDRCLYLTMTENAIYSEIVVEDEGSGIPKFLTALFSIFLKTTQNATI